MPHTRARKAMRRVVKRKMFSPNAIDCHAKLGSCDCDHCSANRESKILSANIPIGVAMTKENAKQNPPATEIVQRVFVLSFAI